MDRCALFVDAGCVLADGAMAVHGTSRRESVSWDYAGLLGFFTDLSAERTGQPMLRCYWYETTIDGRRTAEHDTLADLPGLMLRLGRARPGQGDGADTEIHRDLTTLAGNRAVCDVLLVTADEDLAQVIANVQDLGVRVIIAHISADGNRAVPRSLRQLCDDIVEIDGTQLRPYVELIAGAEPARYDEQYATSIYGGKQLANGHAAGAGGGSHQGLSAGSAGSHPAPPAVYTAPAVAEYQPPAQPEYQPPAQPAAGQPPAPPRPEPLPAADPGPPEPSVRGMHRSHAAGNSSPLSAQPPLSAPPQQASARTQPHSPRPPAGQPGLPAPPLYTAPASASFREPAAPSGPAGQELPAARPGPAASVPGAAVPGEAADPPVAPPPPSGQRAAGPRPPYAPSHLSSFADPEGSQFSPAPTGQFGSTPPGLPSRRASQQDGLPGNGLPGNGLPGNGLPAQHSPQSPPRSPLAPRGSSAQHPDAAPGPGYLPPVPPVPQPGPYRAQLPEPSPAAASPATGGSLAGIVQTAHSEGFEFGESVAREAPALWLEAVLARKPRMPSDLEARLLQGSVLPIDSLLRDEVRNALRRGFWDALERSRR